MPATGKLTAIAVTAVAVVVAVAVDDYRKSRIDPSPTAPMSVQYPGPWREEFNRDIAVTLAKNKIAGCGQFKFRSAAQSANEYLVYCTRDGANWIGYLVYKASGTVNGPFTPPFE
jgi:hypothetical protein